MHLLQPAEENAQNWGIKLKLGISKPELGRKNKSQMLLLSGSISCKYRGVKSLTSFVCSLFDKVAFTQIVNMNL